MVILHKNTPIQGLHLLFEYGILRTAFAQPMKKRRKVRYNPREVHGLRVPTRHLNSSPPKEEIMDNATCYKAIAVLEEIYKKMKEAVSIIESDKTDKADESVQERKAV